MNTKYKQLSEFVGGGGMSAAGISGTYETLAGSGKKLFRKYNHDDEDIEKTKPKSPKIPKPAKSSTQKMKP